MMDDIDKRILNRVQSDFPMDTHPFRVISDDLDIPEKEVLERLRKLRKDGIIRRIGGNFVPEKLGFVSTLCTAKVPADKIDLFSETVNRFPGVTHNYIRENPYNVWFTFIAPSREEIEENLDKISEETGVTNILNLPAVRVYKIKAHFYL